MRTFLQLDDLHNRHVAIDTVRIVGFHSIGDAGASVLLDTGTEIKVSHTVSDLMDRLKRATEVTR